ncbi:MAG: YjjG family noncanonical pyrimidine nucleotidase [Cyclobacteriaceae bacterium]
MKGYTAILFDLDHTLWDYEKNSRETIGEIFSQFRLDDRLGASFDDFHDTFQEINMDLWSRYDKGLIPREVIRKDRFATILSRFGKESKALSEELSDAYVEQSPKKGNLIKDALVILDYLHPKYPLFVVTNGFEEVQFTKVKSAGIEHYFKEIVISDRVGHKKPSREIFDYVSVQHNIPHQSMLMIGDNLLTDIAGAKNAGIDAVFFNPYGNPHREKISYEIKALQELKGII